MKKLFSILLVAGALLISVNSASANQFPEPSEPVCVEGQVAIENDVEFEQHRSTYRWHIVSQTETEVTYRLQKKEWSWFWGQYWDNKHETRTFAIPTCLTTPVCNDPGGANYDSVLDKGEYHDASVCTPQTFDHSGSVGAPALPSCEAPVWAPTLTYLGHKVDENGNNIFSYTWTKVRDDVHNYFVWSGASKDNLDTAVLHNGETIDVNMYKVNTNWIKVAGSDQGCLGNFSAVTN